MSMYLVNNSQRNVGKPNKETKIVFFDCKNIKYLTDDIISLKDRIINTTYNNKKADYYFKRRHSRSA